MFDGAGPSPKLVARLIVAEFVKDRTFVDVMNTFSHRTRDRTAPQPHHTLPGRHRQHIRHRIARQRFAHDFRRAAAGHHAGIDIGDEIFALHGGIDRGFRAPDEFHIRCAEQADGLVAQALDPGEDGLHSIPARQEPHAPAPAARSGPFNQFFSGIPSLSNRV